VALLFLGSVAKLPRSRIVVETRNGERIDIPL
jgi:hypothetical protein